MFKFYNNNKILFFFMMVLSNILIMFSNNWFSMWLWLEMNLISFISMMMIYKNFMKFESSLIYFLIQTIASILFLYSMIVSKMIPNLFIMMLISLLIKLSMAPFHFWMPIMTESMNWFMIFLLLTWQKIGPLMLMNMFNKNMFFLIFIFYSFIIGSILGLNFSSLKKIISYSSINQMSWILYSLIFLNIYFKLYIFMYFYLLMTVIYSFNYFKLNFINQLFMFKMKNSIYMFLFFNMLSLGGLPPFLGFLPKMIIIMKMNNSIILFLMMMFTLITLFYYLRIIMSIMLLNSKKMNMKKKNNYFKLNMLMKFSLINNFNLMYMLMLF